VRLDRAGGVQLGVAQELAGDGERQAGVSQCRRRGLAGGLQQQHAGHVVDHVVEEHGVAGVHPQLPPARLAGGGEDHVRGGHAPDALRRLRGRQRHHARAAGAARAAQPLVDPGGDARQRAAPGRGEAVVAVDLHLDAKPRHLAAALLHVTAPDVELERGGSRADAQMRGPYRHAEIAHEEAVAERDPVLGVRQQQAGLTDRLGGDQRVVTALDVGEEAVPARPLGGQDEAVLAAARPVGQHDLGDARAVHEFLGDGAGQRLRDGHAAPRGGRMAPRTRHAGYHAVRAVRARTRRHGSPEPPWPECGWWFSEDSEDTYHPV
jgi:hypothetical protein